MADYVKKYFKSVRFEDEGYLPMQSSSASNFGVPLDLSRKKIEVEDETPLIAELQKFNLVTKTEAAMASNSLFTKPIMEVWK